MKRALVGWCAHTGWAAMIVVGGSADAPEILDRRRIEMIAGHDANEPPFVYHAARALPIADAARFIESAVVQSLAAATAAMRAVVSELAARGYRVVAGGLVVGDKRRASVALPAILGSHAAIHTAEGELYRDALAGASAALKLPVVEVRARELDARGAALFGVTVEKLPARLMAIGRAAGRPWARDQKDALLAALLAGA